MTTTPTSALDRLAERYGIEPEYDSALGERVTIAPDVKRRLLAAMGARVDGEADAARLLEAAEVAEWREALDPVTVDRTGGRACRVALTLPKGTERVAWKVCFEGEGEVTGEAAFAGLELVGERTVEGLAMERRLLPIPDLPLGYHGLSLNEPGVEATLIVTPPTCFLPETLSRGARVFGVSLQLYLLRSGTNWGIGDFADLARFVAIAGRHGADVVGLNPLHALFLDNPEAASPYSPASRLLLNPLYVSTSDVPEAAQVTGVFDGPDFTRRIEAARAARLVDYTAVAALKREALRTLHTTFREIASDERRQAFEAFVDAGGESLLHGCLFLALREHFAAGDPPRADWRLWPQEYQGPHAPGSLRFLAEETVAVEFQQYVQFIADEQLGRAAAAAETAGLDIGLYRDLAVGADQSGAETWASASAVIRGATVGAPPDIFMPTGQNWLLPPFHPRALREEAYRSFVDLLRANMRHAGGLRIDHVMGLKHLWCTPEGSPPSEGAYVAYPMDDLVGILALESHRHQCLIVGEDLGTVPEGFREAMADANILSYRVLFFEQDFDTGTFVKAADYPEKSVAVSGSHDLPTLRGWWAGLDNDLKDRLGLFPSADMTRSQRERRARDRDSFVEMLRAEGLVPRDAEVDEAGFIAAANRFLAGTSAGLAIAQLDDITGETEPVNLPGTVDQNPNWRRKYAMTVEELDRETGCWNQVKPLAERGRRGG